MQKAEISGSGPLPASRQMSAQAAPFFPNPTMATAAALPTWATSTSNYIDLWTNNVSTAMPVATPSHMPPPPPPFPLGTSNTSINKIPQVLSSHPEGITPNMTVATATERGILPPPPLGTQKNGSISVLPQSLGHMSKLKEEKPKSNGQR
ncbi:unnamed protein product [Amoebophrya sp. A25]|nr:unnamed protein product [Amoebophrya sp. A25]|eukprot:GSA25T00027045001.1